MRNPLTRKLGAFCDFSTEEKAVLDALCADTRTGKAGEILIEEGDRPDDVFLLVEGWGYRYKHLPDGERQILAYLLPGDLCDIHIFILKEMDHGIALLGDARFAKIHKDEMRSTMRAHPGVLEALFWATLVDEAVLREWLVNVGQRPAYERIAHLFYELWLRLREVGEVEDHEFTFPVTQAQLADTVGLTPVHVNRTLQRMRQEGLITLENRRIVIHDIAALEKISQFDAKYLHLDRRPSKHETS